MKPLLLMLSLLLGLGSTGAAITENSFSACSLLGGTNDSVRAARIQSDGSIVLAANVSDGPIAKAASGTGKGMVICLAPGGAKVLAATRVSAEIRDLAIDGKDQIYVALGQEGAIKL